MKKYTLVFLFLFLLAVCSTDKPQISETSQTTQFTVAATDTPILDCSLPNADAGAIYEVILVG